MRIRVAALTAALAVALPLIAACGTDTGSESKTAAEPAPETGGENKPAAEPDGDTAKLPDLTGKGLQAAQDTAQDAGFHHLTSHDSLGRARNQIMDRNWKVCSQKPGPGEHATDTKIDLGAVKVEENCPAKDEDAPADAGDTMPNFAGKSAKAARAALPSNASITVKDVSEGRMVLVESNWKVCTQQPAAGTALDGQPVTLGVVKFEEICP